ncbi:MAG: class II 3-deoxy-7-phosphoheptulonate synthase [Limisphaerales bacterium]
MQKHEIKSPDGWSPTSWLTRPALQQPIYPDPEALQAALTQLSRLPPLVTSYEIESLKGQLAAAETDQAFLLQGGDCCETFEDCESDSIAKKLKILLQMSLVLVHGGKRQVIRVGRFAGQYAKPRSAETETKQGLNLASYRGDIVNRPGFSLADRSPNPENLVKAYGRAALTLNFIRSLVDGGFADLHHPEYWELAFVSRSPHSAEYTRVVQSIGDSLRFMETLAGGPIREINRVDFFTSHEGLLLHYEQAQTRQVPRRQGWYNLSTHFPWIGERTRQLDGAHLEYFRGIRNPIGVKIGPAISPAEAVSLAERLNPHNEPGRLTFICRFGARQIQSAFPPIVDALRRSGRSVLWCSDPMHGNTETTGSGIKTRRFENILAELEAAYRVLKEGGAHLGGVHFELTGDDVTECVGGASGVTEADLTRAYRTLLDPRLNYEQAMEMALLLARLMSQNRA